MSRQKESWFDLNKVLSYHALLMFVIGGRSIGKTFSVKRRGLTKFKKEGKPFIYLRRNKTEIDRIDKDKFFNDTLLKKVFRGYEEVDKEVSTHNIKIWFNCNEATDFIYHENNKMVITGSQVTINGRIVTYFKSLSTWVDLKGSEYDDVDIIMFDEVLIDTASRKIYLKNEVQALLNLIFSVARQRENLEVYLLSNATNYNNPYFAWLKFMGDNSKEFYFYKKKSVLIHFPRNKPFENTDKNESRLYKLLASDDSFASSVDNEFQVKPVNNVYIPEGNKVPVFNLFVEGQTLGVFSTETGDLFISNTLDEHQPEYSLDLADLELNKMVLSRSDYPARLLRQRYYRNRIIYKNINLKIAFINALRNVL